MTHTEVLKKIFDAASTKVANLDFTTSLTDETERQIDLLVSNSESFKAVMTVLITLCTHKIVNPAQDIRCHQAKLPNGFSGRTIDSKYITPFMKEVNFPAMKESGWLTRSIEQPHAFTLDFPGDIKNSAVKSAFLHLIDKIQCQGVSAEKILEYVFKLLIKQRDSKNIELAKPHSLSIATIVKLLERHFTYHYTTSGASRLPTLAIYAAYQCMMTQVARYKDKTLCSLEAHNSADSQSGRIGDIDINNEDGKAFEGVEIKHEIPITVGFINDAYEKFKIYNTDRYYLLTTANMDNADWNAIDQSITRISQIHGCQVIVNGVYSSLKYYLRLMTDPAEFIDKYVDLLKKDETIKYQHKIAWNDIISEGIL